MGKKGGGTGLPASIEAAWGLQGEGRAKRVLSVERILEAAIAVADEEGLGALSMGRIAEALGASTMSLYRYVATKDELLALMIDEAFRTLPAPLAAGEGWRAGLTRWAEGHLAVLRRHPWILRVPVSGPPITPHQIGWMERALQALRGTALTPVEKPMVVMLLSGFVRNLAITAAEMTAAALSKDARPLVELSSYARVLETLADPVRFPELAALLKGGVFEQADVEPDPDFRFGLARILDGVDALLRARKRQR